MSKILLSIAGCCILSFTCVYVVAQDDIQPSPSDGLIENFETVESVERKIQEMANGTMIDENYMQSEVPAPNMMNEYSTDIGMDFSSSPAMPAVVPSLPSAQPCCESAPAPACCAPPKTRKKLVRVNVQKEVSRLKRVCLTDECGCTKEKLMRVKECKTRKRLKFVDVAVDPCEKNCLGKLRDRLKNRCNRNNDCCN